MPVCPHAQIQPAGKIRCVLAHDVVVLRQGLKRLLEDEPDIAVVAEAGDAATALQRVADLRPDIVIAAAHVFENMADSVRELISQESPTSKLLFLTVHSNEDLAKEMSGDQPFAARHTTAVELVEMVRFTATTPEAAGRLETDALAWPAEAETPAPRRGLTAREREVLKLLAEGRTVRTAADMLGLSMKTVDAHKFNLMRKLGIHNKAELVMWAIQKKVVKLPVNL